MSNVKPRDYWLSLENTINEAKIFMRDNNLDHLPGHMKIFELGNSSLGAAIQKYHGGYIEFRGKLNEPLLRRENGLLEDIMYVKQEIKRIMKEHKLKTLPSANFLVKIGEPSISNAITKYGGFTKFRKLLGEKKFQVEDGKWQDENYVILEAKKIMKKLRKKSLPTTTELWKAGYNSFVYAVVKYHGGIHDFRLKLGGIETRKKMGLWENIDYALEQAEIIIKKEGWESLSTSVELFRKGYSGLRSAIHRYHGGHNAFSKKLNQYLGIKSEEDKLESLLTDYASSKNE